ncbi:hypothetical protein AND_002513 [Anopheles darlingi]|uniref:Uncharacterized protein n=1 Tax=Anopheles darlingi TaxID=43151 RepID=W5JQY2_ANODA|nr:hypothetical protein AND_002513 [Anopheles darlingi]
MKFESFCWIFAAFLMHHSSRDNSTPSTHKDLPRELLQIVDLTDSQIGHSLSDWNRNEFAARLAVHRQQSTTATASHPAFRPHVCVSRGCSRTL